MTTPPGWYPDPRGGAWRYWDGMAWTGHAQPMAPAVAPVGVQAPRKSPGVDTNTVWIWLLVLLPLVPLVMLLFLPWSDMFDYSGIARHPERAFLASLRILREPWYWVTATVSYVIFGFTVWFAARDRRELLARGIDRPFHWAWQFLSPVYAIGRSVVVKNRTGGGLGPLWALCGLVLLSFVVSGVIGWMAMESAIRELGTLTSRI